MANFQDESTDCAICLGSLMLRSEQEQEQEQEQKNNEKEQEQEQKTITLKCGHRYHLDCIIEQIKVGSMIAKNDDQRLLFTGIQCAKCAKIFVGSSGSSGSGSNGSTNEDHPDLPKDLIRSTDKLRTKVDKLIIEQNLLLPLPSQMEKVDDDKNDNEALFREARRKYAFYLCSHCEEPYFGGTIRCADENPLPTTTTKMSVHPDPNQYQQIPAEKRLCPGCTPETQLVCQNPIEHGRYLIWKCRYCCKPSTHVCYGQVHFCKDCHDKNSQRVATAATASIIGKQSGRPTLEAIPCPGGESCKYPKPPSSSSSSTSTTTTTPTDNCKFHSNGSTKDCEQVYSCAICDSVPDNDSSNILNIESGSHNFVFNPNGEFGLNGWRRTNQYSGWHVEERHHEEPVLLPIINDGNTNNNNNSNNNNSNITPITTNFVSSFQQCVMMQSIDLSRVLRIGKKRRLGEVERDNNPNNSMNNDINSQGVIINDATIIPIEVSARYTGRDDCPSVFMLSAILSDHPAAAAAAGRSNTRRQDQILNTEVLEAPPGNYWERTSLVFNLSIKELETRLLNGGGGAVVTVIVKGKDVRFWQGNFGSKVADISVRILGNSDFINELVNVPPSAAEDENENDEVWNNTATTPTAAGVFTDNNPEAVDRATTTPISAMTHHRIILWDIIIPVACFLILAWLAASNKSEL